MHRLVVLAALSLGGLTTLPVYAQSHEETDGKFTLRSSVVASTALPDVALQRHGIEPSPRRALLNVVVLDQEKDGVRPTVKAEVQAHLRTLSGARRAVDLRAVSDQGRTSYLGVFEHASREVISFDISARPEGADKPIELSYEERMAP